LSGFQFISLNNENKILSSNIHEKINHKELVEYILDEDDVYEIDYLGNYYVSKLPIKEGNFAILKGLKYDLEDFISDIIVYFLLSLVVSTGVFFIGRKFIIRVLRPVEENIKSMNEFIHNAGHELKTPLSVIDSNIQIIDDIQQYDALMNTEIRKELAKMVELLNTLTDLSNIQNEKSKEKCNISEIIQDILSQYKEKINEKEYTEFVIKF
jgi:signal transduction histidine kinase